MTLCIYRKFYLWGSHIMLWKGQYNWRDCIVLWLGKGKSKLLVVFTWFVDIVALPWVVMIPLFCSALFICIYQVFDTMWLLQLSCSAYSYVYTNCWADNESLGKPGPSRHAGSSCWILWFSWCWRYSSVLFCFSFNSVLFQSLASFM